jgi:Ca2+:H+ antiporter
MNWLLILVPVALGLEGLAPERHLLVFLTSAVAILPLAGWMGRATEDLAERMGEGVGGLSSRGGAKDFGIGGPLDEP